MKTVKHILTGDELSSDEISQLLHKALLLKKERVKGNSRSDLAGRQLALLFEKPSLRTRFSFTVAMRELGGDVIESIEQTRKSETPEDQARVLNAYCDAIMLRTYADSQLQRMSTMATIPIINGLSDQHHPCQALADLLTLLEVFGTLKGLTLAYVGDGNNVLNSLLLLAPKVGVTVHYCCPVGREPMVVKSPQTRAFSTPQAAVNNAHAVYTDVWVSMGFEEINTNVLFDGFQVNEALLKHAASDAIFMHCMPMVRGQEVSATLPDQPCSVVFQQSENRLHVQKALLIYLINGDL